MSVELEGCVIEISLSARSSSGDLVTVTVFAVDQSVGVNINVAGDIVKLCSPGWVGGLVGVIVTSRSAPNSN